MSTLEAAGVIFDFDYTLADSSTGIVNSVNYALGEMGIPLQPEEEICQTIGLSLPETLRSLTGLDKEYESEKFSKLFILKADQIMADSTSVYDFVDEMTKILRGMGLKLGIVSSKYRRRIEGVLSREHLLNRFDVVIGGDDVSALKPDPSGLLEAINILDTSTNTSLYVGDSVTDAETSIRANVEFAAVLSGVTSRERFHTYGISNILQNASEVPSLLSNCIL